MNGPPIKDIPAHNQDLEQQDNRSGLPQKIDDKKKRTLYMENDILFQNSLSHSKFITEGMMKKSIGANTILYPTPVLIVGTYDKDGKPNGMTAAWGGICCSKPPCVTVSLRKATYSYGSIVESKAYTLSIPVKFPTTCLRTRQ